MKLVLAPIVLVIALAGSPALGEGDMRCGGQLITVGLSMADVQSQCGAPDSKEPVTNGDRGPVRERWIYQQGAGSFSQVLSFEGGQLVNIQDGSRQS